jgi:hypothetical protein
LVATVMKVIGEYTVSVGNSMLGGGNPAKISYPLQNKKRLQWRQSNRNRR